MSRERATRRLGTVLISILLVLSLVYTAAPAVGASAPDPSAADIVEPSPVLPQTAANNSTVVHENPQNASGSQSPREVRRWLANRMTEVVIDCTEQTRVGSSYACSRLDRQYPEWASRYVEIMSEDDSASRRDTSQTLSETRRDVQTLAEQVEEFRELEAEYEAAKAAGDDQRARELAHRLVRQSRDINRTSSQLTNDYDTFENTTSTNLSDASDAVVQIDDNATKTANEVRDAELVGTTLAASATQETGSFVSPLVVEGRLSAVNGTPVGPREVQFRVGNGSVTTQIDSEGRFTFEYRPTSDGLGQQSLTVVYRPENASLYGRSTDSVAVDVQQTTGSVSVLSSKSNFSYRDTVRVSGRVQALGEGAGGVPVAVTLGEVRLGTVETNDIGRYELEAEVPANVSAGEVRLVAGLPFQGRALTAPNASATVSIAETPTALSLRNNRTALRVVNVDGQLRTRSGPVAGRAVTLSVDGSTVGRVRTGPDGGFSTAVDLPASVSATDSATLVAEYTGDGENLAAATDRVTIDPMTAQQASGPEAFLEGPFAVVAQLTGAGDGADSGIASYLGRLPRIGGAAVGLAGLLIIGLLFSRQFALRAWLASLFAADASDQDDVVDDPAENVGAVPDAEQSREPDLTLLTDARERLSDGRTDEAVVVGYEAVRRRLLDRIDRDPSLTHWELVRASESQLADDQAQALERLTEAYERAAFSRGPSSAETTRTALANAAYLLDEMDASAESGGD